ncbi:MAG TPA: MYXO-CTERM sorting domain-containing protein [Nannocystis sp.]
MPSPAYAFSTRIHIMIANKVRESLVDSGNGKIALRLGEHSVTLTAADIEALSDHPLSFRAGAVGPDNMVFPGMTDPSHALGQRPFEQCELLYQAAELPEERAYALGCFLHGSTDAVAHHYVNYMTGETFTLTPITSNRESSFDNVVRHILAESQIQAAAIAQDPGAFTDSRLLHSIPIGFVLRAYLDQDSPLWQMMAAHPKAEYDKVLAEDPEASLPTIVAKMEVGPADHLVLSPVYLASVDDLIVKKKIELMDRIATMQDWNSPEGSQLKVTAGDDGTIGTKDDETDCSASCPELFATYFTFVGLLAPRYNAQNQELPSAFEKVSEQLRKELFLFHEAYLEVVAGLSAKLNAAPNEMSGEFGVNKEELKVLFQPLNDWADKLSTIDYDTLVYATVPEWFIELDTFMQAFGVDFDIAALIKAVFDPIIQPIKDAIKQAFIEQAQVFIDQLVAEIEAKKEPIFAEYDARLAAAAHPNLDGDMLDHFYDSGLFAHAFNIAATAIANHASVLPVGDDPIGVGPASFDASYTPAWMQAGACDYLQPIVFPLGIDVRGALSVRTDTDDYPAQVDVDSPIECHAGSLGAFADLPTVTSCAIVKIAALLGDPLGSLSRAYPPNLAEQPATCISITVPGLPAPPPVEDTDTDAGTDGTDAGTDAGTGGDGTGNNDTGETPTTGGETPTTAGPTSATAGDTTGDTAGTDGDSGCGCNTSTPDPTGLALGLFGLLGLRRRRRAATLAVAATLGLGACGDSGGMTTDDASTGAPTTMTTATTTTATTTDPGTTGDVDPTTTDGSASGTSTGDDSTTDPTTGDDTSTTEDPTGASQAGELLDALNGTTWRGEQTRAGKTRAYELRFDSDSLLWSELRNPFGPARNREMRSFKVEADGLTAHSTVIQPQGWPVNPENGRKDDWTIEVIDGDPRILRTVRDGAVEEFTEGSYEAPTDGLTAIVRVFKVGGVVDKAFCDSGPNGFEYPTIFDFARGKSDEIVATDFVAGARLLKWTDPSNNNQFSINDIDGFDRLGGTELSDTFNFFVTYTGTIAHPGGTLSMRENDDSVEDAVWTFLGDKAGNGGENDIFFEVQGFAWPDASSDEPDADFGPGELPIEAIVVRCTESIKDVDVEIQLPNSQWSLVGNVQSTPPIDPKLFPPAL